MTTTDTTTTEQAGATAYRLSVVAGGSLRTWNDYASIVDALHGAQQHHRWEIHRILSNGTLGSLAAFPAAFIAEYADDVRELAVREAAAVKPGEHHSNTYAKCDERQER